MSAGYRIHPSLAALAFPIAKLAYLPGNPRKGNVEAVARSYAMFGQRKPIVARREGDGGIVTAGNHQLEAARSLGWEEIAVVWVDDDDLTARAFALADNHSSDLGTYDDDLLAAMIADVAAVDALLEATSYTQADLNKLLGTNANGEAKPTTAPDIQNVWAVVVECENEADQVAFIEQCMEEGRKCRVLVG